MPRAISNDEVTNLARIQDQEIPHPADLQLLEALVDAATERLDSDEMRSPETQASFDPFRVLTGQLARLLLEAATLSPWPSIEVSDALGKVSCKILKRADRCRHHPEVPSRLPGTAHGYFFVLGELGRALNFAQSNRRFISTGSGDAWNAELMAALEATIDPWPGQPLGPVGDWRRACDWLVRDIANAVLLRDAEEVRSVRVTLETYAPELVARAHSARTSFDDEMARIESTLDALAIVLGVAESFLTGGFRSVSGS